GEIGTAARYRIAAGSRAITARQRDFQRRTKILGNPFPFALRRNADQPHNEEERHHRRHEIGVGDLPAAAVRCRMGAAVALDHAWLGVGTGHGQRPFTARTCSSSSTNDGLSVEYSTLRPNSTAN